MTAAGPGGPGGGPATIDAFLGGLVTAVQPARGHHRSGLEAVLLAAAVPAEAKGLALDLGAGAGVAGFCLAARCPGVEVVLVEREAALVAAAEQGRALPSNTAFTGRVTVARLDIEAPEADRTAAGLVAGCSATVLVNPPFRSAGRARASPSPARAAAHLLSGGLDPWFRFASWGLRAGGALFAVVAADLLPDLLLGLAGRFGSAALLPIHPRPDAPAHRLLVRAVKGSRAAPAILPGLVLHGPQGSAFAPPIEAVLRGRLDLSAIHPAWQKAVAVPS